MTGTMTKPARALATTSEFDKVLRDVVVAALALRRPYRQALEFGHTGDRSDMPTRVSATNPTRSIVMDRRKASARGRANSAVERLREVASDLRAIKTSLEKAFAWEPEATHGQPYPYHRKITDAERAESEAARRRRQSRGED